MKKLMNLAALLKATKGDLISEAPQQAQNCEQVTFTGYSTDTRVDMTGKIFFPLKGEQFDAHQFLTKAYEQKAACLVVHEENEQVAQLKGKVCIVKVKDTLKALQDFGHYHRKHAKCIVLGITGSNGKTTSKEFTAALIGAYKKVHYNKGSFNNHWGVPMTLLDIEENHEVAIVEMGMDHYGELALLAKIAEPDVVVVTMVGKSHIENFGAVENTAKAKEEIYENSSPTATRIYNLDNPHTLKMYERGLQRFPQAKKFTFSQNTKADVNLQIVKSDLSGMIVKGSIAGSLGEAAVPVFGEQNLYNLMVATSMALAAGLTPEQIWQALPLCKTNWGRNQLVHTKSGAQILFDGYNANPDSMKALLDNFKSFSIKGKKVAVLGEMLALGDIRAQMHFELAQQVAQSDLDEVWFYGESASEFAAGLKASGFNKISYISDTYEESLAKKIASVLKTQDIVLVKGSRGMKLERFVLCCEPLDFSLDKK